MQDIHESLSRKPVLPPSTDAFSPRLVGLYYVFGLTFGFWALEAFFLATGIRIHLNVFRQLVKLGIWAFLFLTTVMVIRRVGWSNYRPWIFQSGTFLIVFFLVFYAARLLYDFYVYSSIYPYFVSKEGVYAAFAQMLLPLAVFAVPMTRNQSKAVYTYAFWASLLCCALLLFWTRDLLGSAYRDSEVASGHQANSLFFTVQYSTIGAVLCILSLCGWHKKCFGLLAFTFCFSVGVCTLVFGESRAPLVALFLAVAATFVMTDIWRQKRFAVVVLVMILSTTVSLCTVSETTIVRVRQLFQTSSDSGLFGKLFQIDWFLPEVKPKNKTVRRQRVEHQQRSQWTLQQDNLSLTDALFAKIASFDNWNVDSPFVSPQSDQKRFYSTLALETPGTGREAIWMHAAVVFLRHPIFGNPAPILYSNAHNAVIESFAVLGILGGSCFVLIMLQSLHDAWIITRRRPDLWWFIALYIIVLFISLTAYGIWQNGLFAYFVILRSLTLAMNGTTDETAAPSSLLAAETVPPEHEDAAEKDNGPEA